ncbi:MAG: ferredoxin reductase family protein [Intrasporangiaceae bacterium]|nr:ferredoxin reductase family protein [Intrasporangiaceae bacterium]
MLIVASCLVWWFPYVGAGGMVAIGLFTGTVAIVLMAWGFVLAVRWRWLEPLFGGLDRMYAVHRWVGVSAMGAMLLHVRLEPEVEGGFDGLLARFMDAGTDAAELAEPAFYVLVAISLVRWVPYRWWRLSHKLLGVPFVFVAFHTVTVDKPFPPNSAWSLALAAISVVGVLAWLWRVVGRDGLRRGLPYRVVSATVHQRTLELELSPVGRALRHRAGRFAFVKMQLPGLREPHPFTIASAPQEDRLRFFVRDLGDWTASIQRHDLVGALVRVEGPYGRFEPLPHERSRRRIVWVAGGVGITPFLSAVPTLPAGAPPQERPLLVYAVHTAQAATAIEVLRRAAAEDRMDLEVVASAQGRRLDAAMLRELVGGDLAGAHVAVCGPRGLVATVERAARQLGAEEVESEDFDIRSGVGPDLSREIAGLGRSLGDWLR